MKKMLETTISIKNVIVAIMCISSFVFAFSVAYANMDSSVATLKSNVSKNTKEIKDINSKYDKDISVIKTEMSYIKKTLERFLRRKGEIK